MSDKWLTEEEVSAHNSESDCWLIIGEKGQKRVYDVTFFLDDHPGGPEIILDMAGQDATDEFEDIGHSADAVAMLDPYCIGRLKEKQAQPQTTTAKPTSTAVSDSKPIVPLFLVVLVVAFFYNIL